MSGLATGMRICSGSSFSPSLSPLKRSFSSMANLRAERSVAKELTMQVTRIITMVPLRTSSFMSLSPFSIIIWWPTSTAAKVAAADALLRPKTIFLSFPVIPKIFCEMNAPIHLLPTATSVIIIATFRVEPPEKRAFTSIIIPTPIRKYGIKIAFPTNSNLFISGDTCGMSLLRTSPVRNAPMIPSIPTNCIRPAPRNTIARTNTNCIMLSE